MDWQVYRKLFPVTAHWAFLDHAAVAPLPAPCASIMSRYAEDLSQNGIAAYLRWAAPITKARLDAGRLLNTEPSNIAFTPSTTAGIGYIAEGFPWQPGDNVVTSAEEYPSNQYPWMNMAHRGVEVRAVPSVGNTVPIDALRDAMDSHTRVLAISSVEFASGYFNDLAALGEICRQRNIFFFVDAIQSLGVLPLDLQQYPIDALSADGHKWLLGPEGAGIFFVRPEWVERLHTIGVGWNSVVQPLEFSTIDFRMKPHAGRWEGGTYNTAGIAGLGASMDLLLNNPGIETVSKRVMELTDYICEKSQQLGIEVFSNRTEGHRSGIVSLISSKENPQTVLKRCREAGIIINVRGGRLRLSPHAYNTFEEIDRFLEVVQSTPKLHG